MKAHHSKLGFTGIGFGAVALLTAIVHFWAGPFSPQPSLETSVARKAIAIKNATIATLKGEEIEQAAPSNNVDIDRGLLIATSVIGALAIILGVISFANKEPFRVGVGAVILGGAALAFQFAVIALGAIILLVLVGTVLNHIGIE